ncbi:MAG: hypothetical protein FJ295_02060 [Planctomycetes bacterium]|nr:hypothetical protein [Planctomycetota bacterium]
MIPTKLHAAFRRRLPLLASLLLAAGCHGTRVEESEHHTPAHKPADFPAAVDRLLALHVEILNGRPRANDSLDVFTEAHDVVRWLPELAADSDLGEEPWNIVYATAQRLEAILTEVRSPHVDDRSNAYLNYETELGQHQRALIEIKQKFPAASPLSSDQSL